MKSEAISSINPSIEDLNPRQFIIIKNAAQNNLKSISLAIPQNKLIVITGVSGSGKSSLAFDTIYAEGQRRYVESLSAYIRQFMGKIEKPNVEYIKGLSPAVAIQQKVNTNNPRSTVGTATEIYDYLKLLFARIGKTISPVSGGIVKKQTVDDVVDFVLKQPEDTKILVMAPIIRTTGRSWKEELNTIMQKGFSRIVMDKTVTNIEDFLYFTEEPKKEVKAKKLKKGEVAVPPVEPPSVLDNALLLIDRISAAKDDDNKSRIADSIQTAFFEGHGECILEIVDDKASATHSRHYFSDKYELDGIQFEEPSVNLFSFNNPYGACKTCEGFGKVIGIDENKVIPNKNLSVYEGAVAPWKGESMGEWRTWFVDKAAKFDFPIHRPYKDLTRAERDFLWKGNKSLDGIRDFFAYMETQQYKIQYRVMLSRYKGKTDCFDCEGKRLRQEASYVKINGYSITDLVEMQTSALLAYFKGLKLDKTDEKISIRILNEIINRLQYLNDVGLGYLTLNREARTLSGGESQRIQIVTSLGSNLTGALYILDEPSIGLHSKDTEKLIEVLQRLKELGNTVIVVEHDEEIIRQADEVIDIGPLAGVYGGELVFQGDMKKLMKADTLTAKYMRDEIRVPMRSERRKSKYKINIEFADKNNLKDLSCTIPLNAFTVVTGVSGSGKSTLVREILYPTLKDYFEGKYQHEQPDYLTGDLTKISRVEYLDQNPIGKSSRSNPVTFIKAFDPIRELFAAQPMSKMRGYTPGYFSFNVEGGRCETCKGDGYLTIEMQFMADVRMECEDCNTRRYKDSLLEVTYNQKSIADVLDLSVTEALEFFKDKKEIYNALYPLEQVGLGYVSLGQPSIHLSGGEAQRIKLASFLSKNNSAEPICFIFDEPTTGLHFHDIHELMESFQLLVENGHTLVVIEHNLEVIKCADHIIDLGPAAGDEGGNLVFEGTPEELVKSGVGFTGRYLASKL